MAQRDVLRNPDVPELSLKAIELITQLCFRKDDPLEESDLIFVFSTAIYEKTVANIIEDLLSKNLSDKVILNGGEVPYEDEVKTGLPEWKLVQQHINVKRFPNVKFYHEENSTNTLENVTESLKVLDFSEYKSLIYIFKSYASGRGYLTLRKFLPNTELLQVSFPVIHFEGEEEIRADNWFKSQKNKQRVWGEFLRIKTYGMRGDIEFDEVKSLVNDIESEITS